jgi:hypothetical protein
MFFAFFECNFLYHEGPYTVVETDYGLFTIAQHTNKKDIEKWKNETTK